VDKLLNFKALLKEKGQNKQRIKVEKITQLNITKLKYILYITFLVTLSPPLEIKKLFFGLVHCKLDELFSFLCPPLAVFEKIMQFSKFLILQAKMRIDKNARLQAFVQKT
jgi:hypothetical protein